MIRYYNGGFDHWKLLELTYKQCLMYYSHLIDMLETENGAKKKEPQKATSDPNEVMHDIKNTIKF